ncbi:MAG: hypothetical protein FWF13_02610 [Acidobacteria bacterium]|nr:hypothetical protein [Acidobacteriota bacterium]
MKRDESALIAKRQYARLNPENTPSLKGIALSQGTMARVIDISRGGALIETDVRLCPQSKIGFKVLMAQGDFRITGSVLRSSIKSLKGPIYQSAIVFENPLTILDEIEPAVAGPGKVVLAADEEKTEI